VATLAVILPDLASELAQCLRVSGRNDLADQIQEVEITRWTHDAECDAAYIYLRSPRQLNVVELNVIGVRHGETVPVKHPRWVNLAVDNFGRIMAIELLNPGNVPVRLAAYNLA
jgi:uncharacterized protein YuzE